MVAIDALGLWGLLDRNFFSLGTTTCSSKALKMRAEEMEQLSFAEPDDLVWPIWYGWRPIHLTYRTRYYLIPGLSSPWYVPRGESPGSSSVELRKPIQKCASLERAFGRELRLTTENVCLPLALFMCQKCLSSKLRELTDAMWYVVMDENVHRYRDQRVHSVHPIKVISSKKVFTTTILNTT